MKQYTNILADYLSDLKYEDIPAEVIQRAKQVTLHALGVALAANPAKSAQDIIRIAKDLGTGEHNATIIGDGSKVSASNAALANGTLTDLLDWEDCSWTGHPTGGAVPAGIAVAEAFHKTGKEYLTALVGAYDIYTRVAMAVQPSVNRFSQGWGLTSWQIFAPAMVTGKLMGLEHGKMNQLMGTAAVMTPVAINLTAQTFSDFYHFQHGLTAKQAIECAMIVDAGIDTLMDGLESYSGYHFGVSDQLREEWYDKELGESYYIMELLLKHWPVNMWLQVPLDMADELVKKHSINPEEIDTIYVSPTINRRSEFYPGGYPSLVRAQFSIPFCIAMLLVGPQPGHEWADHKYLNDAKILDFASRVLPEGEQTKPSLCFNKFREKSYPKYGMRIIMKDGTEYKIEKQFSKGHPKNFYTIQDSIDVFKLATSQVLSEEKADALIDFCLNRMEEVEDMSVIGGLLKA